jgi:hypothetical protein
MTRGILYVETRPISGEVEGEYHQWYEQHMRELVGIDGVISSRRFAPIGDDAPFVALYEIESEDIAGVQSRMIEAFQRGEVSTSPTLQRDPSLVTRLFKEISAYEP